MDTDRIIAAIFVAIPWIVLTAQVAHRGIIRRSAPQRWMYETTAIGAAGAVATLALADTGAGWMGYGIALLAHGLTSIASRVGTAYERLVAMPGGDRHAVECLGVRRWYALGVAIMTLIAAVLAGAGVAVVQLGVSEIYSRYRRAHQARGVAS